MNAPATSLPDTSPPATALYEGYVVHKRLRPKPHALKYRVMPLLIDVAELARPPRRLRLFSYNRFNLFSLRDRDHGAGDGTPIAEHLAKIVRDADAGDSVRRFMMLCYPRVLGFGFNPLTVYFGLDGDDRVRLVVYEVNNTFGERKSYVMPARPRADGTLEQGCGKRLHVSPFNDVSGSYLFHASALGEQLTVGVALTTAGGPLLKAYFHGHRKPFTDAALLRAFLRSPWMGLKVIAGIHLEALRLWLKGLPLRGRPPAPLEPVTHIPTPIEAETRT